VINIYGVAPNPGAVAEVHCGRTPIRRKLKVSAKTAEDFMQGQVEPVARDFQHANTSRENHWLVDAKTMFSSPGTITDPAIVLAARGARRQACRA
jgi:hypothetical protein